MKSSRFLLAGISLLVLVAAIGMLYQTTQGETLQSLLSNEAQFGLLQISAPDEVSINQPFSVNVVIDTNGSKVNAAGLYLRYDPDMMQLTSMNTSQSFCQFYPEKRYDQRLGTISLACGSPHPGVEGENTMMQLEFMPVKLGTTVIRTENTSQLLLSDGKGDTNILQEFPVTTVTIQNTL